MSQSSEKFCLKWKDFQTNIAASFLDLRSDTEFSDVTLVCEEDHRIEAHRVILTACSPFFRNILKKSKHSHPLIYMRGIKAKDLVAIVDFIYHGEANIFQEDLDGFLALAEELQLKGLSGPQKEAFEERDKETTKSKITNLKTKYFQPEPQTTATENFELKNYESFAQENTNSFAVNAIVPYDTEVMNLSEDLEAKKMSMIEKVEDGISNWRCIECGKTTKVGTQLKDMKRHTETHFEGVSYPCNQCGKSSRSSNALRVHVSAYHGK